MTIWTPDIAARGGPRYQAIADAITDAVARGELAPGDRLPPQRDLAWRLGVTVGTVSRAYLVAEQKGLLSGEVGRGTFVREAAPLEMSQNASVSVGHADALAAVLADIAKAEGLQNLLRYMPAAGHPEHRAAGAAWIARVGLEVPAERIVLSTGAQQGLAASFHLLARPGEAVLAEELTYSVLIDAARIAGVKLVPVALDDEGVIPDALDKAARESGAKVVVVQPTVQNPTATIMGDARRRAIAEIARRRDLMIVEDDVYGFLTPGRPVPIAVYAPERTVYIASASKCVAPGLRAGWIAAPEPLVERFAETIYALSAAQPALTHEIVRRWIEDGTAEHLAEALRVEITARQAIADEILRGLEYRTAPACFHVMLNLPRPWRRDAFRAAALSRGIKIASIAAFAIDPETAPEAVRLSVCAPSSREAMADALGVLADLARSDPRASRTVI
jgi:DNA-binding transcriptional MocR family regulator